MNRRDSIKLLAGATGIALTAGTPLEAFGSDSKVAVRDSRFETKSKAYAVAPEFTWLRFGSVKPKGWLKEQMLRDLHTGFAGSLDKLCPDAGSDVYITGHSSDLIVNSGRKPHPAWWFGEAEGNWRAGWIMLACLSDDQATMRRVNAYVERLLAAQAPDGYIGVFNEKLRYKTAGDLWTQACLLRGLLAYAEFTQSDRVFQAIVRACDGIMAAYPSDAPMKWSQSHDLMICDVLERLFEITGDARYREFAVRCFESWSAGAHDNPNQGDDDATLGNLNDPGHFYFLGHSVHTVEHLRVPIWLASVTGRRDYEIAARNAIARLAPYSFSTGAVVGNGVGGPPNHRFNESINNGAPDPYEGEWEYCTVRETLVTFSSAFQKTGNMAHADRVERIFFNAAQGGRLPDGSALTYMTPENRFCCIGRTQDGHEAEPRNTFSPTSDEVAVCCNPNGTQVSSHFVRAMWMRHSDGGLAALLYGPATVTTDVAGTAVTLDEQTNYPFDHAISIVVTPQREAEFTLHLRTPAWSPTTTVSCEGAEIKRDGDFSRVTKRWRAGDTVHVQFHPEIRQVMASNREVALQYGALLFALPIASKAKTVKTYPVPGFQDSYFEPVSPYHPDLVFRKSSGQDLGFTVAPQPKANLARPFDAAALTLRGTMTDTADGRAKQVELVPFGNAVPLRQLTFPVE